MHPLSSPSRPLFAGLLGWLLFLVLLPPAAAQPEPFSPEKSRQALARMEQVLTGPGVGIEALNSGLRETADYQVQGEQCLAAGKKEQKQLEQALAAIGPSVPDEAPTVSLERKNMASQQAALEKRLGECRLLVVKAKALTESLTSQRWQQLARQLLHRRPDIVSVLGKAGDTFPSWSTATLSALARHSGLAPLAGKGAGILAAILLASAGLGLWLRRHFPLPETPTTTYLFRLIRSILITTARALPWLLPLAAGTGVVALLNREATRPTVLPVLLIGLTGFALLHLLTKAILQPPAPAASLVPSWPAHLRGKLHRRLIAMGLVALAALLCKALPLTGELPAQATLVAHNLLVTLGCLLFLYLTLALAETPALTRFAAAGRPLVMLTLTVVATTEWLGFHNLAVYLGRGLLATLTLAVLTWGANTLLCQLFYMLAYGRKAWRQQFSIDRQGPGDAPPSVTWARALTVVLTWSVFGILLIRTWRISDTFTTALTTLLLEGFKMGNITVVPSRIVSGLLLFTALWTLSSWLRNRLGNEWLPHTHLPHSARDTMATVTGYVGFILAVIFGLATAGFDFTSLAVIAGALSVGIGFGLQNIVNNFVSGLILLFERPIKRGDWIRVGDTEGYVRKISVRSTVIQTFDRADIIVPNSDLISTPVTNLMLEDRLGRVKASVGVAYGSDTALVKRLLEEVATNHPLVISDGVDPKPQAFFLEFGDSSLNFELRCFIRDVGQIFMVRSDLNFAIDAAFRANNVQIPFPQRDLHVIDLPDSAPPTDSTPT